MRIGIDVRYLSHGLVGGVHTYVKHFVEALIELVDGDEIVLYADRKEPLEVENLPASVEVRLLPWRSPLSSLYNDLAMGRHMQRDRLDLIHFPANYGFAPPGIASVVTLHDAINILPLSQIIRGHPKTVRTIGMMTYLHMATRASLRRASLILTVSAHAKREIGRYSNFDPDRIVPIPHAPTPDLRRITESVVLDGVRRRHGLDRPYVLADALKNPAVLVDAWRRLPESLRRQRQIVFFARHADVDPAVEGAVGSGEAALLIRPSRADLIALYSMADAFVFPSWYEGFGIPVLEAMTCGAPVIASDRGGIPEVAGEAALYIDAEDSLLLAHHLVRVLSEPDTAQRLRELGFARAHRFTWQETARQILVCYQASLSRAPARPAVMQRAA